MQSIKRNKVLIISSPFFLIVFFLLIPTEWEIIYINLISESSKQNIIMPVKSVKTIIENTYGAERSGGRQHQGIDIFAPRFTPVISAVNGIVLKVGRDILGGNTIKILGLDRRIYYYAHLSSYVEFETGEEVKQGKVIGFVGNTGNAVSTPPHLHFEIMEIKWFFPMITENINPYSELQNAGIIKMPDSNNLKMDYEF